MFCRLCGENNSEDSLYCSKDGEKLHSDSGSLTIVNGRIKFCKECGESVLTSDLYCQNCASSLYSVKSGKKTKKEIETTTAKRSNYLSQLKIKDLFKYSLIGVGIILLISMLTSKIINEVFMEALAEEIDFYIDKKFINFLDVATLLNVSALKVDLMSGLRNLLNVNLKGMVFILTLIPLTVFTIIGAYVSRVYDKKGQKIQVKEYLFMALSYSLIISLLSIVASRKMDFNIPYLSDYTDFGSIEFIKKYSFISTLIKSFLLSLFSLGFGSGIYDFFKGFKAKKFSALATSSFVLIISSIFTLIFMFFANKEDGSFYPYIYNDSFEISAFVQMFVYLLLFVNMGTFKFKYDGEVMKASLFENMDMLKNGIERVEFLYIGLFISMFVFFFYGRKAKKSNKDIKAIFYAPLLFSLGLGILAYLTSISISMTSFLEYSFDSIGIMSFEFNYLNTFLASFLVSILASFAGYFLTNNGKETVSSYE